MDYSRRRRRCRFVYVCLKYNHIKKSGQAWETSAWPKAKYMNAFCTNTRLGCYYKLAGLYKYKPVWQNDAGSLPLGFRLHITIYEKTSTAFLIAKINVLCLLTRPVIMSAHQETNRETLLPKSWHTRLIWFFRLSTIGQLGSTRN